MEELLVFLACTSERGCKEATDVYFHTKPEVRELIELREHQIKKVLPTFVVQYGAPVALYASGKAATVKLTHDWYWKGAPNENSILYMFDF
jgi:hypothetical protein